MPREVGIDINGEQHVKKLRLRFAEESAAAVKEQTSERLSYASDLCAILTEKCNIRCRHCLSDCSPSRIDDLDMKILKSVIQQAAELSFIHVIGFSGGEPFIDIPRLETAVALCREHGLAPTVTTNGFWASGVTAAKEILRKLEGLIQVCLSTDEFHQEFIPVDRIANAIIAAHELGIHCAVVVTHLKDPERQARSVKQQLKSVDGLYEMQQWPVVRSGRALVEIPESEFYAYDVSNAVCVSADMPTLNANGKLTGCCGPAGQWPPGHRLELDSLSQRSLKDILEVGDRDPVIQSIRVWGPAWLLELAVSYAQRSGISLATPEAVDMCAICEYLFTNPSHTELVEQSLQEKQILRELAVARMARLGEVSMFLNLDQAGNGKA